MKRYDFPSQVEADEVVVNGMAQRPDGDWVRWEDVAAEEKLTNSYIKHLHRAEAERDEALAEVERLRAALRAIRDDGEFVRYDDVRAGLTGIQGLVASTQAELAKAETDRDLALQERDDARFDLQLAVTHDVAHRKERDLALKERDGFERLCAEDHEAWVALTAELKDARYDLQLAVTHDVAHRKERDEALAEVERLGFALHEVSSEIAGHKSARELAMTVVNQAWRDLTERTEQRDGLAAALRAACGQFAAGGIGGGISAEECDLKAERYREAIAKYAPEGGAPCRHPEPLVSGFCPDCERTTRLAPEPKPEGRDV